MGKTKILLICDDIIGKNMAGPGIRVWEMAASLSKEKDFEVGIACPDFSQINNKDLPQLTFFKYSLDKEKKLINFASQFNVFILSGYILDKFPQLKNLNKFIIADLYIPFILENLFVHDSKKSKLADRQLIHNRDLGVLLNLLLNSHHFLCANERQKNLYSGMLFAINKINPYLMRFDRDLSKIFTVIPFGIREEKKKKDANVLRGIFPDISESDIILIWGGVLSNWFDPIILIEAVEEVIKINPSFKLFFLSTKHPNPLLMKFPKAEEAKKLASQKNLLNKFIFFNKNWIPYNERHNYFLESDIGVSAHLEHFETQFSFRTRVLDYIYFNLPVICSKGDFFEKYIHKNSLGITVTPSDKEELKKAILSMEDKKLRERFKRNIKKVEKEFYWDNLLLPLKEKLRNSHMLSELKKIKGAEILTGSGDKVKSQFSGSPVKYLNKFPRLKKILPSGFKFRLKRLIYKNKF
ncbi:MAG: glycosyltransferase family 4 protein [Candidatus Aminicenantes bacterium]|nr:glycosyltransferase family 4 protein [Candidatus Aminicenantes bacterium]